MRCLTLLVAFFIFVSPSFSSTIQVPLDYAKIQDAIDMAVDGDVVLVHPGEVILPELGERLGRYAQKKLDSRGVEIRTKTKVTAFDGQEVTRSTVEVRHHDVLEALGGQAAAQILEHRRGGGRLEVERAGLRHGVGGGVDEWQLEERPLPMPVGQEAQHSLDQRLALERVGAQGQVRSVHLER